MFEIEWVPMGWKMQDGENITTNWTAIVGEFRLGHYMTEARRGSDREYSLLNLSSISGRLYKDITLNEAKEITLEHFKKWLDSHGLQIKESSGVVDDLTTIRTLNPLKEYNKGHTTRFSDSSLYDEKCTKCGATDAAGDDRLNKHCPVKGTT